MTAPGWPQRKGKRGERLVASILGCRRGLQFRGAREVPDVDLPGWWPEVRTQRRPNIARAYRDAREAASQGREPVAVTHADDGPWLVTMSLEAFAELVRRAGKGEPHD